MVKHVIDASRAGEVLDEFLRRWKYELTDEIAGTVLNFRLNREVDALCRRVADNPDLPIDKVTAALRAPLAGRILLFLANSTEEDEEIRAGEWGLLAKARLPTIWDGKPFDPGSS
jgi:hypothetical protein